MNNNNLGRVAVRTSKRKAVPTPLDFDVNATMQVGEIVPFMIREGVPGSTFHLKTRNLIRLATMNVPTYGRLKLNLRHSFVGFSDLTENFPALMAETMISRGKSAFVPNALPNARKGFLSFFNLVGAHISLYHVYNDSDDSSSQCVDRLYKMKYNDALSLPPDFVTWFGNWQASADFNDGLLYKQHMPSAWRSAWNGYDGPCLNIAFLQNPRFNVGYWNDNTRAFWIPIENKCFESFFDCTDTTGASDYFDFSVVPLDTDESDAVLSVIHHTDSTTFPIHLAARFSNFGRRWFNLLVSSGCGIDYADFSNDSICSLMPLFAYYKAYFDDFGLLLYTKWEMSSVSRLMRTYDDLNVPTFDSNIVLAADVLNGSRPASDLGDLPSLFCEYWCNFVCDVGTAFYTEEYDFTSVHQQKPVIDTQLNNSEITQKIPNDPAPGIPYASTASPTDTSSISTQSGAGFLYGSGGTITISQLSLDFLKRATKVLNRDSVVGQAIAKRLEMLGYGDYVNECKSRFLGEFNVPIDFDEVTATSDFFDTNGEARSQLGEQGGKGVGFGISKNYKYKTNEFGYYIVLASIVPESGYVNLAMAQARNISKLKFYSPEYDGLGMELNTKEFTVSGTQDFADPSNAVLGQLPFGFVPQYSKHKVQPNFCLGGFGLRSERGYYSQYHLDKLIRVGERDVKEIATDPAQTSYQVVKTATASKIPVASPNWRYVGRYPWLENYLRIFASQGDPKRNSFVYYLNLVGFNANLFDFTFRDEDKFIVQNRFVFNLSAPWLKITDAYETKEDGNVGSSDVSVGKS